LFFLYFYFVKIKNINGVDFSSFLPSKKETKVKRK
jgi:hypothetical protein